MFRRQTNRFKGDRIRSELIGYHAGRCPSLFLQELTEQSFRCFGVTFRLYQEVQTLAFIVHGTPQPMPLLTDNNDHFVQMPVVAGFGPSLPQVPGYGLAKLKKPLPHGLKGDIETALREEIFYVSKAQSEPGVEPYCVADDFRWKTIALKENILHLRTLLQGRHQRPAELM